MRILIPCLDLEGQLRRESHRLLCQISVHEQLRVDALIDLKLLLELAQEFLLHVSKVGLKVMNGSIQSLDQLLFHHLKEFIQNVFTRLSYYFVILLQSLVSGKMEFYFQLLHVALILCILDIAQSLGLEVEKTGCLQLLQLSQDSVL